MPVVSESFLYLFKIIFVLNLFCISKIDTALERVLEQTEFNGLAVDIRSFS